MCDYGAVFIHENGHSWGLGESLTELLAEEYTHKFRHRKHDWEYCTVFDRALLEKTNATDFWHAALKSEAAYSNLWDKNLPVKHADVKQARGVFALVNGLAERVYGRQESHEKFGFS